MKFLINANFVAIRRGDFVVASASAGECILDTKDQTFLKSQLAEVAAANKIKLSTKLSLTESYQVIEEALSNMTIPEQNEPTESQKVLELVRKAHEAGEKEDKILVAIIQAGISYKKAGKLYKAAIEELGIVVNTKDLKTRAGEIMSTAEFAPKTHDEVDAMAKKIAAEFPKAEFSQVTSIIRRYLRANKLEIPETPKGQRGATGFRGLAFAWILANPTATTAQFKDWAVKEKEKSEDIADRFVELFQFAKNYADAVAKLPAPVAEKEAEKPAKAAVAKKAAE